MLAALLLVTALAMAAMPWLMAVIAPGFVGTPEKYGLSCYPGFPWRSERLRFSKSDRYGYRDGSKRVNRNGPQCRNEKRLDRRRSRRDAIEQ